jgi:hypothetical protein
MDHHTKEGLKENILREVVEVSQEEFLQVKSNLLK